MNYFPQLVRRPTQPLPSPKVTRAAYNPLTDSNLVAYYSALELSSLYQDSTLTTPVTTTGQPIGGVRELKAGINNLLQATSTRRVTYTTNSINGKPAFTSDGLTNKNLRVATPSTATPQTVLIVWQMASTADNQNMFDGGNGTGGTNRLRFLTASSNLTVNATSNLSLATAPDLLPHYGVFVFNGASSKFYIDGEPAVSGNPGSNSLDGLTLMGNANATSTQNMVGAIGMIAVISGAYTNFSDIYWIQQTFLKPTWGFT